MTQTTEYDVIIVGGGFGGIYQTWKLRQLGLKIKCFERGKDLGGVWRQNVYPGARVDSEVPVYQLWIKDCYEDFNFELRYPGWKEIQEYFAHVEKKIRIAQHYDFNTNVDGAIYNEKTGKWTVTATGDGAGTYTAKHLVLCIGFASKHYTPDFKDLDKFKGIMHHTARWPLEPIDPKGKRVAVVGTGASGVQVIQEWGPDVEHLTVYQRTPNLAIPMGQRPANTEFEEKRKHDYPAVFKNTIALSTGGFEHNWEEKSIYDATEEEREAKWESDFKHGGFRFWVGTYKEVWSDREADTMQYNFWRKKVLARLTRPEFHDLLAPEKNPVSWAGKRPSLEQRYYEVYNQPNVDIVNTKKSPIIKFTEKGILTEEGEKEFDIIVLATGFDAFTGGLFQMNVVGKKGQTIKEKWSEGVLTYLGVTTADFPNMYFMYGPQGPTAFSNGPTCAQMQANWITDAIQYVDTHDLKSVEPTEESEKKFKEHLIELQNLTMVRESKSWYVGGNIPGKRIEAYNFLGGVAMYGDELDAETKAEYSNFVKVK